MSPDNLFQITTASDFQPGAGQSKVNEGDLPLHEQSNQRLF